MTLALIYGEEDFLVEEKVHEYRQAFPQLRTIDGGAVTSEQLLLSLQSTGLFAVSRQIEIRSAPWLMEEGEDLVEEIVVDTLGGLASNECVIFWMSGGVAHRGKLFQFLKQHADVFHFPALPPWNVDDRRRFLEARASREGKKITASAAEYIVESGTFTLQQLAQEVAKLAIAVHPAKEITLDVAQALVSPGTAYAWQLSDQLLAKNTIGSLGLLRKLLDSGEPPFTLVPMLAKQFRTLLKYKLGMPLGSAVTRGTEWRIKKAGSRFSQDQVEAVLRRLLEIDEMMKRSAVSAAPLLESLVVQATSPS